MLFRDASPADAGAGLMAAALGSPHEVSGAAYLPRGPGAAGIGGRACGSKARRRRSPSRRDSLVREFGDAGAAETLGDDEFDRAVARDRRGGAAGGARRAGGLAGLGRAEPRRRDWPKRSRGRLDAAWYLDWGGGLVWLAVPEADDGGAGGDPRRDRRRGPRDADPRRPGLRRATVPVFEPQPPALAALARRVKDGFDPRHILNPGRMVDGV